MTPIEIFNFVKKHLLNQNKRASSSPIPEFGRQVCSYRTPEGLTCAVGCLFSNDDYRDFFENFGDNSIRSIVRMAQSSYNNEYSKYFLNKLEEKVGVITTPKLNLLERLQNLHDRVEVIDWSTALDNLEVEIKAGAYEEQVKV